MFQGTNRCVGLRIVNVPSRIAAQVCKKKSIRLHSLLIEMAELMFDIIERFFIVQKDDFLAETDQIILDTVTVGTISAHRFSYFANSRNEWIQCEER